MADDDISDVEIRSGVTEAGVGFNHVVVTTKGGRILMGQLDPKTVRSMALQWLEAAEAAETDGIVWRLLTDRFAQTPPVAAGFIASMRDLRDGGSDAP